MPTIHVRSTEIVWQYRGDRDELWSNISVSESKPTALRFGSSGALRFEIEPADGCPNADVVDLYDRVDDTTTTLELTVTCDARNQKFTGYFRAGTIGG